MSVLLLPFCSGWSNSFGRICFFGLLNTLLDYKLKNRELDIADRRVDVDSHRVDLEEQRLPSLMIQSLALAE